jgi:hypothetical protein
LALSESPLQGQEVLATETHVSREFRRLDKGHGPAIRAYLARRVEPDRVADK